MNGLTFSRVSAGYNKRALVSGLDLEVKPGQIVALIGPNGAGKSTLLKTAAGLLEPVEGEVLLEGKPLQSIKPQERAMLLSVMLTERQSTEFMTCRELISVGRYRYTGIFGRLSEDDRRAVDEAMELTDVVSLAERDFSCLSDGQQQRVLLARAIVSEPKILIMDEPTSFLDIGYKLDFLDVLQKLAWEKHIAVLVSMHEMELARRVADQVVCLTRDSKVDRIGTPDEVLTPEYIGQLFSLQPGKYEEYYHYERTKT